MAFIMKESQTAFFTKVFGPDSTVTDKVKKLIAAGVTFDTSLFYNISANSKGTLFSVQLTKSTTALMKGGLDAAVLEQNKALVADWVDKLYASVTGVPVEGGETTVMLSGANKASLLLLIKAVQTVSGKPLFEAKKIAEDAIAGTATNLKFSTHEEAVAAKVKLEAANGIADLVSEDILNVPSLVPAMAKATAAVKGFSDAVAATAKVVDAVLSLKDAKALGQKVKGTSPGSVYRCIAFNEHVRLAAKLYQTGMISVRAEWTDSPKEDLKKLEDAGVQMKANYGSIHFDSQGVPQERCVAAWVIGTGIKWQAAVINASDLLAGGKS